MRRILYTFLAVFLLVMSAAALTPETASERRASPMPANAEKIEAMLIQRGVISASARPEAREEAVAQYLKLKLQDGGPDKGYNPLARKSLDVREQRLNEEALASIRGRKLGAALEVAPSSPQFKPLETTDKLLLILVDFSETPYTWTPTGQAPRTAAGPLHNHIAVPDNSYDLYVPDFSTTHYENMMFSTGGWQFPNDAPRYAGERRGSMRDYFLEQSYGRYTIGGKAYGWFTVDKPEAYYGDDSPAGGTDNLSPGTPRTLIADAVTVINSQSAINWLDYDVRDPYDMDQDGDLDEPDCMIDHPLFVHAGIDQSGGGGAQGDDAIWAHSWSTEVWVTTAKNPNAVCPSWWPGTRIYNYTIMPEDGGVGVFAHEFGHDLGLPDEYDTAYSGRGDSVAFWSLMSTGSWVGRPAQTQPSDMSIWGRYSLLWLDGNVAVTTVADLRRNSTPFRLEQAERWGGEGTINALRLNLPDKVFPLNRPHSGVFEWWGGKADEIDNTLGRTVDLTGKSSATLSFWTWYDIEEYWDFGFVQVSADGGSTWTSLPIAGTTSTIDPGGYPAINANLPGFTGSSGGWVYKTYDLSAYAGQSIKLQFRYMTDWGTSQPGFFVDDVRVVADAVTLFFDDVEAQDPAWTAAGWTRSEGNYTIPHYYMLEWRNLKAMETPYGEVSLVNFDAGLSSVYQFDPYGSTGNVNEPWWFSYSPGLLLWYRDMSFKENWTGAHPGGGFLLVVDAHEQPMLRPPYMGYGALAWNTRVQTYDATFSLTRVPDAWLGYWGMARFYPGANALPIFDDTMRYWSSRMPDASVITPTYGVLLRVLGEAADGSAALIGLGKK